MVRLGFCFASVYCEGGMFGAHCAWLLLRSSYATVGCWLGLIVTCSKFGAPLNQFGLRTNVAPSAVFQSFSMYAPHTTVGLRISGFAAGSVHDLPCQMCFGTGPIEAAAPIATSLARVSLSTTTSVPAAGDVTDSIRWRSSRPTKSFSSLIASPYANR